MPLIILIVLIISTSCVKINLVFVLVKKFLALFYSLIDNCL